MWKTAGKFRDNFKHRINEKLFEKGQSVKCSSIILLTGIFDFECDGYANIVKKGTINTKLRSNMEGVLPVCRRPPLDDESEYEAEIERAEQTVVKSNDEVFDAYHEFVSSNPEGQQSPCTDSSENVGEIDQSNKKQRLLHEIDSDNSDSQEQDSYLVGDAASDFSDSEPKMVDATSLLHQNTQASILDESCNNNDQIGVNEIPVNKIGEHDGKADQAIVKEIADSDLSMVLSTPAFSSEFDDNYIPSQTPKQTNSSVNVSETRHLSDPDADISSQLSGNDNRNFDILTNETNFKSMDPSDVVISSVEEKNDWDFLDKNSVTRQFKNLFIEACLEINQFSEDNSTEESKTILVELLKIKEVTALQLIRIIRSLLKKK